MNPPGAPVPMSDEAVAERIALGHRLRDAGNLAGAEAAFLSVLRERPPAQALEAALNLALTLQEQGRLAESEVVYRGALATDPNCFDALRFYAFFLHETGRPAEAVPFYARALQIAPRWGEGYVNLGQIRQAERRTKEALQFYYKALECGCTHPSVYVNLGAAFEHFARYAQALICYDRALALEPGNPAALYNRARSGLALGRWQEAWADYRHRPFQPILTAPEWDGAPFPGRTLLLRAEQGHGDNMMYLRYAPLAKARGGTVLAEVAAPLRRLMATCPALDRLVAHPAEAGPVDLEVALPDLPHLFGTTLETIPDNLPYFHVPRWSAEEAARHLGPGPRAERRPRVGLIWESGPVDPRRSCPAEGLWRLTEREDLAFYSFQVGPAREQLATSPYAGRIGDLGAGFGDFYDTAQALLEMDLLITVDTGPSHLAGALGRPMWILLGRQAYWLYLDRRSDSPWYPSATLFRQPSPGDWESVFEAVSAALARHPFPGR